MRFLRLTNDAGDPVIVNLDMVTHFAAGIGDYSTRTTVHVAVAPGSVLEYFWVKESIDEISAALERRGEPPRRRPTLEEEERKVFGPPPHTHREKA